MKIFYFWYSNVVLQYYTLSIAVVAVVVGDVVVDDEDAMYAMD
jgi:hypothetical protein